MNRYDIGKDISIVLLFSGIYLLTYSEKYFELGVFVAGCILGSIITGTSLIEEKTK